MRLSAIPARIREGCRIETYRPAGSNAGPAARYFGADANLRSLVKALSTDSLVKALNIELALPRASSVSTPASRARVSAGWTHEVRTKDWSHCGRSACSGSTFLYHPSEAHASGTVHDVRTSDASHLGRSALSGSALRWYQPSEHHASSAGGLASCFLPFIPLAGGAHAVFLLLRASPMLDKTLCCVLRSLDDLPMTDMPIIANPIGKSAVAIVGPDCHSDCLSAVVSATRAASGKPPALPLRNLGSFRRGSFNFAPPTSATKTNSTSAICMCVRESVSVQARTRTRAAAPHAPQMKLVAPTIRTPDHAGGSGSAARAGVMESSADASAGVLCWPALWRREARRVSAEPAGQTMSKRGEH